MKIENRQWTDLGLFGGTPSFSTIRSISNLVRPDLKQFLDYLQQSHSRSQMTDEGVLVKQLEKRLAAIHETKHCVTFCNGLWGIVLCMKHLALPNRSEVIMPSMSYRRLGDIAAWVGLTPHYCDISPDVLGASPSTVEKCITSETALILIPQPIVKICEMDAFVQLAADNDIPILFDSVEGAYASYKGKMLGGFGSAECFSMHASKLINGFEGGYMTTNDSALATTIRAMRNRGEGVDGTKVENGINANLNEMHAAMTLACLDDLDAQISRNRARYHEYVSLLAPISGLDIVHYDESERRGFKNILVRINEQWPLSRAHTITLLHAENMLVRPYYYPPLHTKNTVYKTIYNSLPNAEKITEEYLLLPSGDFVSIEDIHIVVSVLQLIQQNGLEINNRLGCTA
jgi:dTDP-4-amino-4,6-dideoxygalactose transaminase